MNHDTQFRLTVRAVSWPFVAVMLFMLATASLSIVTLSAMRAYVAGHGVWAGAERDTSVALTAYIRINQPGARATLDAATAIWQGDHTARLELLKPHPDYAVARRGLLAGRNHADDIRPMIWLFRAARWLDIGREPLQLWAQADAKFAGYSDLLRRVAAARSQGEPDAARIDTWLVELRAIHDQVTGIEHALAASIDASARHLTALLLYFLTASTTLLFAAGYAATRRVIRREDAMAALLRESQRRVIAEQQRADALLRSIGDAVIATDRHGVIEFVNTAAEQLTGWSRAEACGCPLEQVFRLAPSAESDPEPIHERITALLSAGEVQRLTAHGARLLRRDGSSAPIGERAAPLRDEQGQIVGMVLVMRDVTPERRLSDQLRHQANHDALTGIPNRMYFERQLAAALQLPRTGADSPRFAVMFLDLDQFKIVNDNCGHHAGDELIRRVAACIRAELRVDDMLARLGGDEFALLVHSPPPAAALQLAERVRQAIAALHFVWKGKTFQVHASIGLVHDDPLLASVTDVLCAADRACYGAKEGGRNRVRVYHTEDAGMDTWHGEMLWAARLNAALEQDNLVLYARAIRNLGARPAPAQPCLEVLLRLRDAPGHDIPPGAFVTATERFGLGSQLDRWVIQRVFAAQARRRQLGLPLPLCMINLPSAPLEDEALLHFIAGQQREYALPAGTIGFEFSETRVMSRLAATAAMIEQLRCQGFCVALDDFSVRASSYGHLRDLPVDLLKIDAAFVHDMTRDPVAFALVEAMHKIARASGILTVATGADDEPTLAALERMQVDFAQGNAIGAELPFAHAMQYGAAPADEPPGLMLADGST